VLVTLPDSVADAADLGDARWVSMAQATTNAPHGPGRLLRRVPGAARPRSEVLDEVVAYIAKRKPHIDPVLASLILPDPQ